MSDPVIPGYTHVHSDIVLAAETVLTNGLPTARITSLGQCGSKVSKGLNSVQVGGPDGAQEGESGGEVDSWLANTLWGLSWLGAAAGAITKSPYKLAIGLGKVLVKSLEEGGIMDEKTAKILDFALAVAGGTESKTRALKVMKEVVNGEKFGDALDHNLIKEEVETKPTQRDWRKIRDDRENPKPPGPPPKSEEERFREMREKNNQGDKSGRF